MGDNLELKIVFAAVDKFSGAAKGMNKESGRLAKALKEAREQVKANQAGLAKFWLLQVSKLETAKTLKDRISEVEAALAALTSGERVFEEAKQLSQSGDLMGARLKFDSRPVTGEAGAPGFEALVIDVDIAARATLRANYDKQSVEIACENVGVLGPARYSLPADEFEDAFWEFGQLLLGMPSRFAGLRLPAG